MKSGAKVRAMVARRMAADSCALLASSPIRNTSPSSSSTSATVSSTQGPPHIHPHLSANAF